MLNFDNYTALNRKVTFNNGRSFELYSQETKRGLRYYYYSQARMFPISKQEALNS